ncbi:MAG: sulfatase [Muribaculaceae bacterium]|nr:sulfatase [Muribaculaceae bacterium]
MNTDLLLHGAALTAMATATAAATTAGPEHKPAQRPNIVYIMTDDHTAQMMSAYDRRHISTPNLDRIAADGVRFTNSFVANSLSGPSRACMLTGKHSHTNGFLSNEFSTFDASQPTFPKYLQQAGYQTALIGKWHLHVLPTGFDHWEIVPGQGDYYQPDFINMQGDTVTHHGYLTNIISDKAIDWLETQRDPSRPFCLLIHHKAIHRNWMADTCDLDLYEDRVFDLPENFFDNYAGRRAAAEQEMSIASPHDMDVVYDLKMWRPDSHSRLTPNYLYMTGRMDSAQRARWDEFYQPIIDRFYADSLSGDSLAVWKYQRYMRDYAKTVASLDRNVGRVLDYLRDHGLDDNTLVVYTSDQGFYMGEHGWFDKRFIYEESLRTPLVMRLPKGFAAHGDIDSMVQNIDYAPTFLDLAGVEIPADMQGVSLLPLLRGEQPAEWRPYVYYHFHEYPAEHQVKRHYGIRTHRYKIVHFYNDIDTLELYDLEADPTEMHNIYGEPGTANITRRMLHLLRQAQEQYDDPIRFQYPSPLTDTTL